MAKIFGTDGIRGRANCFPVTSEVAMALGRAVAYNARKLSRRPKIIVGKDTRLSCYTLEMALVSGICSMGADALMTGPMPTPGVAYLTKDMRCDAGIMITASHNPYNDNGMKVFGPDGFKLSPEEEVELEEYILAARTTEQFVSLDDDHYPKDDKIGRAIKIEDCRGRYISHLKSAFPADMDLCGMRLAIDCANGAAYKIAPSVFSELGAEVFVSGNTPNGTNINLNCGAIHPENLAGVIKSKAGTQEAFDWGMCFDGDADRLILVDGAGNVIDGDVILALATQADIVVTTMSNHALKNMVESRGHKIIITDVGDKNVIDEMRKNNIMVGGESSGHIIYLDHSTTGDGILAALRFLSRTKNISDISGVIKLYPQCMINVPVKKKVPLEEVIGLAEKIEEAKTVLSNNGRVLVRYSGTESLLRVMVEAKEKDTADVLAKDIAEFVKTKGL